MEVKNESCKPATRFGDRAEEKGGWVGNGQRKWLLRGRPVLWGRRVRGNGDFSAKNLHPFWVVSTNPSQIGLTYDVKVD